MDKKSIIVMSQFVFIPVYLAMLLIPLPFWVFIFVPLLNGAAFLTYRIFIWSRENPKHNSFIFTFFGISLTAYITLIPFYALEAINRRGNIHIPHGAMLMPAIALFFISVYIFFLDHKNKLQKIDGMKIPGIFIGKADKSPGSSDCSIKICEDVETGKDVYMDPDSRYVHMLILGPTGGGKTSLMLTPMVYQDVFAGRGVTVIEPKGDFAEKVYAMGKLAKREVIYFNPTKPDCPYFNPLDGKEDEVIETMTTVFEMLAPDSKQYFKDISNNLIRKSLMVIKRIESAYTDPETGISSRPATLITLSDLIHNTDGKGRKMVGELVTLPYIDKSEQKQNQDTKNWFFNEYFAERSKIYENSSGVRTQVSNLIQNKYLRRVLNPENGKSQINFDKHFEEGGLITISTAVGELRQLSSYLGYFLIFTLQSSIFRRPGNEWTRKPNFLYIDECQKYLNTGFIDILTMGRSYRVSAILSTQSRDMLALNAGNNGRAFLSAIDANARNIVLFPGISADDAKHYSEMFGSEIKVEVRHGESNQRFSLAAGFKDMNYPTESVQYSEKESAIYSGSDLMYKDFDEITYRIISEKTVRKARTGIVRWIDKREDDRISDIVNDYNTRQREVLEALENEEIEKRKEIYRRFRAEKPTNPDTGKEPDKKRKKYKLDDMGPTPLPTEPEEPEDTPPDDTNPRSLPDDDPDYEDEDDMDSDDKTDDEPYTDDEDDEDDEDSETGRVIGGNNEISYEADDDFTMQQMINDFANNL